MTCNAQFVPNETFSPDVKIRSLYGDSIGYLSPKKEKYDQVGTDAEEMLWGPCGPEHYEGCYETKVDGSLSHQKCTAVIPMW